MRAVTSRSSKNIKKGATIDMAERFTANTKKLGLTIHGDFIVGLPGETRQTIRKTIELDQEAGCGNHPGIARPRVSRNRILRACQKERPVDRLTAHAGRQRVISSPTPYIPAWIEAS